MGLQLENQEENGESSFPLQGAIGLVRRRRRRKQTATSEPYTDEWRCQIGWEDDKHELESDGSNFENADAIGFLGRSRFPFPQIQKGVIRFPFSWTPPFGENLKGYLHLSHRLSQ
uniref:Uncharacterized protein n=1 Tax=Cucumis melo TaxID=3656 RepID=A0A9I9D4P0_CUCME